MFFYLIKEKIAYKNKEKMKNLIPKLYAKGLSFFVCFGIKIA